MFFEIKMTRNVRLHPRHFGPKLEDELMKTLMTEVAGNCTKRHGYVIAVTEIQERGSKGKGVIQEGTGMAVFPVEFTCIVMRPFKNEIYQAVVTKVSRMGVYAEIGPLVVFLPSQQMPQYMQYDEHGAAPQFASSDEGDDTHITNGTELRLKIVGVRLDDQNMFAVGTIKGDFLGPLDPV